MPLLVIETFDPTQCGSPALAVEALKEFGITLTQRLGARIFALARGGVQFSLAFLEEAQLPGGSQELLLRPDWQQAGLNLERAKDIVGDAYTVLDAAGCLRVVTPDEAWGLPADQEPERPSMLAPLSAAPAPLGMLLGSAAMVVPRGSAWDHQHLEQAAQRLLDGEDSVQLVEDFRYLFRAALSQKRDPSPLLEAALQRRKPELNKELAAAIKNQIDREVGLIFEGLFSEEVPRISVALELLSRREPLAEARILAVIAEVLWPIREVRTQLLVEAGKWGPSLVRDLRCQDRLLDLFLGNLPDLVPSQRARLTESLLEWQGFSADLRERLFERARTADLGPAALVDLRLFLINLLSLSPDFDHPEQLLEWSQDMVLHHFQRSGVLERLALCLAQMGPQSILALLELEAGLLDPSAEAWLVDVTVRWLGKGENLLAPTPPRPAALEIAAVEELRQALARYCLDGMVRGARALVMAASRRGVLSASELKTLVVRLGVRQRRVAQDFLTDLAGRLEPPDDEPIFAFLPLLGRDTIAGQLRRLREEAARESAAAAPTLLRLARLLATHAEIGDLSGEEACQWSEDCLVLPIYHRDSLPALWLGLGHLGSLPGLTEELVERILQLLLTPGDQVPAIQVQAFELLHRGGPTFVRQRVEELFLADLAVEPGVALRSLPPQRRMLPTVLESLLQLAEAPRPLEFPDQLTTALCRILLKVSGDSVKTALRHALRDTTDGDLGVRTRRAWDKEDYDLALRILGAVAAHPGTPESLHNMLVSRLDSFLMDWLERQETDKELYSHRTTPLFDEFCKLLERRASQRVLELTHKTATRLLSIHESVGSRLQLRYREDAQRLLIALIRRGGPEDDVDFRLSLLALVIDLAQPSEEVSERPVALYFVRFLSERKEQLPGALQEELSLGLLRLKAWLEPEA